MFVIMVNMHKLPVVTQRAAAEITPPTLGVPHRRPVLWSQTMTVLDLISEVLLAVLQVPVALISEQLLAILGIIPPPFSATLFTASYSPVVNALILDEPFAVR
jgi:hypothetical protein